MEYLRTTVYTAAAACELLADELAAVCGGAEVHDPQDLVDLQQGLRLRWDYIGEEVRTPAPAVVIYTDEPTLEQALALLDALRAQNESGFYGSLEAVTERVDSASWEENWKQFFKPFELGERLFVRPAWEEQPAPAGRRCVTVDPGASFGTGAHATTQLCLRALEKLPLEGKRVLDAGCGSGILGCAAHVLGAADLTLCDIDLMAERAVRENLDFNGADGAAAVFYDGDLTDEGDPLPALLRARAPYDVVCANIVADVLLAAADLLCELTAAGGDLLLSGIITGREDELRAAYEARGMRVCDAQRLGDWNMLALKKA